MKNIFQALMLSFALLLSSCGEKTPGGGNEGKDSLEKSPDSARTQGGDSSALNSPNKTSMGTFRGTIMVKRPYCGGAAPSKEILEQAKLPRPLPNTLFWMRPGDKNSGVTPAELSFTTDENGNFSIDLPAGKWCLLAKEQNLTPVLHPELYDHKAQLTNSGEYVKWWKECLLAFDLGPEAIFEQTFTFEINCMVNTVCPHIVNPDAKRVP